MSKVLEIGIFLSPASKEWLFLLQQGCQEFVGRSWESVIYPEERTNLHFLVGRTDLLHTLSSNLHDFARTYLVCCLEVKVRE
jgi:hypothetical protein